MSRKFSSEFDFYDYSLHETQKSIIDEVDRNLQIIEKAKKRMDDNFRAAIQQKLKAHWTYHSNAIEGSRLSLGDTIFFLQHGFTVGGKPFKDFLDAKNHSEALEYFYGIVARVISPLHERNQ